MKRADQKDPIKCVVAINVSHSTDAILRKSELSRVAIVGSSHHPDFPPTHMIACSIFSAVL